MTVKAIARATIKTDKRDSEVPAHLLRMNMIPEVYRRSTENRQAQRVLRQRAFYVSAMTALKNRIHAFLALKREEIREVVARETDIFSEKGQKALLGPDLAPTQAMTPISGDTRNSDSRPVGNFRRPGLSLTPRMKVPS
jgi:transposase